MANEIIESPAEKAPKKSKKRLILSLTLFILGVFLALLLLYISNSDFRVGVNETLRQNQLFSSLMKDVPTAKDIEEKKSTLARYYMGLDKDRAVDKIMLLKKDDPALYRDILIKMRVFDNLYSQELLKEVRDRESKKDLLQREFDSMKKSKENILKDFSTHYTALGLADTIKFLEEKYDQNKLNIPEIAKILKYSNVDYSAKIYHFIREDIKMSLDDEFLNDRVYFSTLSKAEEKLQNYLDKQAQRAKIYENKELDVAVAELQDQKKYTLEDVSNIFIQMDYKKAGKILAQMEDKSYVNQILEGIKSQESVFKDDKLGKSDKLYKMVQIWYLYQKDLDTLKRSYEKLQPAQVAEIVNQMTTRAPRFREYRFEDENFRITEEDLMLDILKKIKPKFVSQVLAQLDSGKAAEITRKLGWPNIE